MPLEYVNYKGLQFPGFHTKSTLKIIFIFLVACSTISRTDAQSRDYKVERIPLENELYGFCGTCILQDREGFMWFGSQNGLFRYDGKRFVKFLYDPEDSTSISHEEVQWILEDDEGTIWVSTVNGINKFDKSTGKFTYYLNIPAEETRNWNGSGRFILASDGYLYISFIGGFSRFDRETGQFKNFTTPDSLNKDKDTYVNFIYENSQGELWIREGFYDLYLFHKETETFELVVPRGYSEINDVFEDASGRTWFTSLNEIYQFKLESNTSVPYLKDLVDHSDPETLRFMRLLEDREGTFWVNSFKGIHNLDQEMKNIYSWYFPQPLIPSAPTWVMAGALYEDRSGNIWFFTEDAINKVVKDHANFKVYDLRPDDSFLVNNIAVESLNSVWFTDGQLMYNLNPLTELIQEYTLPNRWGQIVDIQVDRGGNIWVSTLGNGMYKALRSSDGNIRFENCFSHPADSTNLPGLMIKFLSEDNHNRIWINTDDHLPCYLDLEKNRIFHLKNNPDLKNRLHAGAWVHCENSTGKLMVSDNQKVYILNPILKDLSDHSVTFTEIASISGDSARNFKEMVDIQLSENDPLKPIWMLSDGLLRYDPGIENFTRYHLKDGLPSSSVCCMLEDNEGMLWLGTNSGLAKFNPGDESVTLYMKNEGLPENSFSMGADKAPDGQLFFGTRNGLVSFYPDSLKRWEEVPPVFLTDLKINNEAFQTRDDNIRGEYITYVDSIRLRYNENNILIQYAALDFVQSSKVQYEYILEGQDKEWTYAGNRAEVNYTNLDPGNYTFRVNGSNHDGVWNDEGASLYITIRPPPWRTWWAYIFYGIVLVLMVSWYRSYLLARAKLRTELEVEKIEKEKALEMDHMRSRFFANISHEFRTPLSLILGPIEDAAKKRSERIELKKDIIGVMHRNARRLQQLINQLLDISKLESGKVMLQVSKGSLDELVKTIAISYESLAASKQINFTFDLPASSGNVYFDRDKVVKILSNLLSNAFKFTSSGGEVHVRLRYGQFDGHQSAEIVVSDTGIGIAAEKLEMIFDRFYQVNDSDTRTEDGTGIGLALTKELVNLYRGEISAESTLGKGSTFRVEIPVSFEQFNEDEFVKIVVDEVIRENSDPGLVQEDPSDIGSSGWAGREKSKDGPIILIVEDNIDLSNYIVSILDNGYRILTAQNGMEGLELATENIPDLVISDVMMPQMDGMEMCSKLKSDERTSHIPVVMLTARADRGSKMEGLETGADDYIIKPFNPEELKVRVRNMIGQRKKLIEKFRKEFESDLAESDAPPGDQLLEKLMTILNQHLADPEFNIAQLPDELHMSRAQMFRKVSAITGYTPKELIRNMRIKKAASLFRSGHHHVAQVMHQVGFDNQSYFGVCFSKLYGLTPTEYIRSNISQALDAE